MPRFEDDAFVAAMEARRGNPPSADAGTLSGGIGQAKQSAGILKEQYGQVNEQAQVKTALDPGFKFKDYPVEIPKPGLRGYVEPQYMTVGEELGELGRKVRIPAAVAGIDLMVRGTPKTAEDWVRRVGEWAAMLGAGPIGAIGQPKYITEAKDLGPGPVPYEPREK